MLNTEEYYNVNELNLKKGDTMFHMASNGNMLQENMVGDMGNNTPLLDEFGEFKPLNGGLTANMDNMDDQRALQLAFELSMLGLTSEDEINYNDLRMKKSMNMTECVPVPSSEHVAEIVGRQGKFISMKIIFTGIFRFLGLLYFYFFVILIFFLYIILTCLLLFERAILFLFLSDKKNMFCKQNKHAEHQYNSAGKNHELF